MTAPYYTDDAVTLYHGDCLDVLRELPDSSVDAVVTDPPYGLEFMGREWDRFSPEAPTLRSGWDFADQRGTLSPEGGSDAHGRVTLSRRRGTFRCSACGKRDAFRNPHDCPGEWEHEWVDPLPLEALSFGRWCTLWATECLRVLKPGGHLLAFGGSRTWHRLACAVEDAGFEIRDSIAWLYGCHDDQTEVLTRRGWVNGLDLTPDDDVAQWSTDGTVELVRPTARQRYAYDGPMVRFRNADVDQLVTPNHRVYRQVAERRQVAGRRTAAWSSWQVDEAAAINRWQPTRLPAAGVHDGPGIGGTDYAALLGWVWAEGGFDLTGTGVRIYQSSVNQPFVDEIAALLDRLGPHKRYDYERAWKGRPYTATTWFLSGDLARRVRADLPGKSPTWDLLWRMTAAEKRALWDAAMKGDGSKDARTFWQKDRAALEWAQALLAGIGARGKVADNPRGALHWQPSATVELQRRHLVDDGEDYTGEVWCVTVPSGAFIVRRNGRVSVSGNSGFPKSLDVSKAIDKAAGVERTEVVRARVVPDATKVRPQFARIDASEPGATRLYEDTAPATPEAARWQGWGSAMKPAFEPVVVARKPLIGTIAQNVLTHGTGALNIDACRVEGEASGNARANKGSGLGYAGGSAERGAWTGGAGRWPTNVVLDDTQAAELDRQTGDRASSGIYEGDGSRHPGEHATNFGGSSRPASMYADTGGASRFFPTFRYEAKAPTSERPRVAKAGGSDNAATCGQMRTRECNVCGNRTNPAGGVHSGKPWPACGHDDWSWVEQQSAASEFVAHPTVKPLDLMRWLVRLVTPPGGVVLDPFAGSGTTAEACVIEGFRCIAIEREADYLPLIVARLTKPIPMVLDLDGGVA